MTSSVMANSGKDAYNRYLRDGVGIDIPKPQVVETKPTTVASGSGTDSSSGNTNSGTSSSGYHGDLPAVSHSNPGPASNPFGDRTILIGVSCGSREFQKRHLVRSMQINKYPGYDITWRFVMGRPLDIYRPALEAENKTYGDLIIIERANDTWEEARIYKPFMFFQYVEKNLPEFKWVAKMDTDTFMNLPLFFQDYFNEGIRSRKNLVVALNWLLPNYRCGFPEGGFYALTWDLLILLNGYFDTIKPIYPPEDMQFGQYFCEAGHHYDQIDIPLTRAFHWDPKEDDKRKVLHTIYDDSVRIHDLKKEEDYVKVADCYHKDGFNATRVALWKEIGWDPALMDKSKY